MSVDPVYSVSSEKELSFDEEKKVVTVTKDGRLYSFNKQDCLAAGVPNWIVKFIFWLGKFILEYFSKDIIQYLERAIEKLDQEERESCNASSSIP